MPLSHHRGHHGCTVSHLSREKGTKRRNAAEVVETEVKAMVMVLMMVMMVKVVMVMMVVDRHDSCPVTLIVVSGCMSFMLARG